MPMPERHVTLNSLRRPKPARAGGLQGTKQCDMGTISGSVGLRDLGISMWSLQLRTRSTSAS